MNVRLFSGVIETGPASVLGGEAIGNFIDKEALLVYTGTFQSAEGEVTVKDEDINRTVINHNLRVSKAMAAANGEILPKDCPPIQLDHSPNAKNTIGRLRGPVREGVVIIDGIPRLAMFGNMRISGRENVERVVDGRWVHGSVGADFDEGFINEFTITPFPAAEHAAMLSKIKFTIEKVPPVNPPANPGDRPPRKDKEDPKKKNEGPGFDKVIEDEKKKKLKGELMDKEKLKAHLMEKHKLSAEDADKKLAGMTDDDQTAMSAEVEQKEKLAAESEEKELRAKCRKHLTEGKKMSEKDADEKLSKMSKEDLSKLAAESDEEEKKAKLASEADKTPKAGKNLEEEEIKEAEHKKQVEDVEKKKLAKLTADAKAGVIKLARASREGRTELTAMVRKEGIGTRLSKLRKEAKITPAELTKVSVDELSKKSDDAIDAFFSAFEMREPQVLIGQLGSSKAADISKLSREHSQDVLMEETIANMSFTGKALSKGKAASKGSKRLSSASMLASKSEEEPEAELESYYGSVCKMMEEGKRDEAFKHLRDFMAKHFAKQMAGEMDGEKEKRLSALAEKNKSLHNEIEELVKLVSPLLGLGPEDLK